MHKLTILPRLLWFLLFAGALSPFARAQTLTATYAVNRADSNIFFGAPPNYRGCPDSLFLDLYKPVNNLLERPIVVLVHGGGFVAGERKAPTIVRLADSIASRGYVVASVEYRMGYFQPPALTASFGCVFFQAVTGLQLDACVYAYDTAEVYRALYRAVQDVRGAIRFLKGRAAQDSSCVDRVAVGGESAGGVIALTVATLDLPSEKPVAAGALSAVPAPNPGSPLCTRNPCPATDYSRPDLGGIEGDLWTNNGHDAGVTHVLSFAGGMLEPSWMNASSSSGRPAMYLYHQSCDPIVSFNRKRVYQDLTSCINCAGCPPIAQMPYISGGNAVSTHNNALPTSDRYPITEDFITGRNPVNCYYGLWGPDGATCPQPWSNCPYCSNTAFHTCHDLFLTAPRMDDISQFLYSNKVAAAVPAPTIGLEVYPNPAQSVLRVEVGNCPVTRGRISVRDIRGRTVLTEVEMMECRAEIDLESVGSGMYFLIYRDREGNQAARKFAVRK